MNSSSWWWLVGGGLVVIACSTGTTPNASSAGSGDEGDVVAYCDSLCGKEHSCDTKSDEDTCFNSCKNDNAARMPHLRGDLVGEIAECISDKDCKVVLANSAELDCSKEVAASAAPSEAATSFCSAYVKAGDKCGLDLDKATCLTASKFYNDDSLAEAEACATDKQCDAQAKCIKAAFGGEIAIADTDVDSGPGTDDTGNEDAGDSGAEAKCTGIDNSKSLCDVCRAANCCTEFTAYVNDPKYDSFYSCTQSYPSASQISTYCSSSTSYGTAYTKYNAFISCGRTNCAECPATRGE